ncbi:hypothetical protein [Methylosinus sp.]|uniref:hypothetical protein n=1 Tax=Methylosinus sp. TaxID=427 RepID=UPI002F93F271
MIAALIRQNRRLRASRSFGDDPRPVLRGEADHADAGLIVVSAKRILPDEAIFEAERISGDETEIDRLSERDVRNDEIYRSGVDRVFRAFSRLRIGADHWHLRAAGLEAVPKKARVDGRFRDNFLGEVFGSYMKDRLNALLGLADPCFHFGGECLLGHQRSPRV